MLHKTVYLRSSNDIVVCKDEQDFDFDAFNQKSYILNSLENIESFSEVVRADTKEELRKLIRLKNKFLLRGTVLNLTEL